MEQLVTIITRAFEHLSTHQVTVCTTLSTKVMSLAPLVPIIPFTDGAVHAAINWWHSLQSARFKIQTLNINNKIRYK